MVNIALWKLVNCFQSLKFENNVALKKPCKDSLSNTPSIKLIQFSSMLKKRA